MSDKRELLGLTEAEAKGKICLRAAPDNHPSRHCVASRCMAWRWIMLGTKDWLSREPSTTHGYCGLGGDPT